MSEAKKWIILTDPEALEHFGRYARPVCQLNNVDIFNADGTDPAYDDAEDARLIARAPNMDAALREAVEAMERVATGGNHLGLIIGDDHPPHTASHDTAREHYFAQDQMDRYEAWCCWREMYPLVTALARCRAALGEG